MKAKPFFRNLRESCESFPDANICVVDKKKLTRPIVKVDGIENEFIIQIGDQSNPHINVRQFLWELQKYSSFERSSEADVLVAEIKNLTIKWDVSFIQYPFASSFSIGIFI